MIRYADNENKEPLLSLQTKETPLMAKDCYFNKKEIFVKFRNVCIFLP